MMNVVRTNDIHAWNQRFIEALIAAPGEAGSLVWPVDASRRPRASIIPAASGVENRGSQ
jgi:hypothetical protein